MKHQGKFVKPGIIGQARLRRALAMGAGFLAIALFLLFNPYASDADIPVGAPHASSQSPQVASSTSLPATAPESSRQLTPSRPASAQASVLPVGNIGEAIDRIKAIQQKTALHQALIEDHQQYSRYPAFNSAFKSEEQDPVAQRYEADERTTASESGDYTLTVWTDQKYYLKGDTARIYARLLDAEGGPVTAQLLAQVLYQEQAPLGQLTLKASGEAGLYTAEYPLSVEGVPRNPGLYKVLIVSSVGELTDALTFVLSEPQIELTGNYRDQLTAEGDLLIEAEVKVSQASRFYIQASLYTGSSSPIGESQYSGHLPSGSHWIPLMFYGLMIQDAAEHGPYWLKNMSLSKVALPIQRAPILHPDYYTSAYGLDQFQRRPYGESVADLTR